ncbi:MAG TPA: DUF4349 domain-containing protein [Candidatus Acidoferrales bacterium]
MLRKCGTLVLGSLLLVTAGCEKAVKVSESKQVSAFAMAGVPEENAVRFAGGGAAGNSQRFVATRHKLEVIASESNLPKAWESVIAYCGTIECTVVSSNLVAQRRDAPPFGSMSLRVSPGDLKKLFDQVEKHGQVVGHATESEDKTTTVLDTDARIKNLTSFRDSLRTMLAKSSASVKDLVEIQQQLTEVQSQLDSETAQRKILANETEKVAVEISIGVERSGRGRSAWTPIGDALRESGSDFAASVAWLITAIVTIIPWFVLIAPLGWLVIKFWRRFRRKTSSTPS